MTVYVDNMMYPYRGMLMSHMMADTLDELHEMADKIGVQRRWFQNTSYPHYDIAKSKRDLAVKYGAVELTTKELILLMRAKSG